MCVDRDLALVHRLKQGRLSFRSGPIDLIRQKHIRKHRAALEFELLLDRRVDRDAQNVRGQHVAGELYPLESAVESPRHGLAESRLANAGNAFDEEMSAGKKRDDGQPDNIVLAANYLAEGIFQLSRAVRNGARDFR